MSEQQREERRLSKRYKVSTLAQYRWRDSNGAWISQNGMTLDISVAGVYILAVSSPPTGAPIEMKIALPVNGVSGMRRWLVGNGIVTRVNSQAGFAAQVDLRMLRD